MPATEPGVTVWTAVRARRAVEGAHAAQHARRGRERAQPARLVVPVRVRHELVPQRRAQVRPHLPGEAGAGGAHERAPALRGAPPRETRERGRGAGGRGGAGGGGARRGRAEGGWRWRGRGGGRGGGRGRGRGT